MRNTGACAYVFPIACTYLTGIFPTVSPRCLSDLISYRVQLAIEDYRRAEGESQAWEIGALLPPMMEGNYEMAAMQCVLPYSEQVRHGPG